MATTTSNSSSSAHSSLVGLIDDMVVGVCARCHTDLRIADLATPFAASETTQWAVKSYKILDPDSDVNLDHLENPNMRELDDHASPSNKHHDNVDLVQSLKAMSSSQVLSSTSDTIHHQLKQLDRLQHLSQTDIIDHVAREEQRMSNVNINEDDWLFAHPSTRNTNGADDNESLIHSTQTHYHDADDSDEEIDDDAEGFVVLRRRYMQ
jgi:hypothetical protein